MKKRSKKILAVLLTAGLVASSSVTAWADAANNETANSSTAEETGSKTTTTVAPVEISGTQSEPVTVDGNVVGRDAEYGVEMKDSNDSKLSGAVTVKGSVSMDDSSYIPDKKHKDPNTGMPYLTEVEGVNISSKQGGNATVNITGDVTATAEKECKVYSNAIGVYADTNAKIDIGGNVKSTAVDYSVGLAYPGSSGVDTSKYSIVTNVGGDVTATTTNENSKYYAIGIRTLNAGTYETTVDGNVKADGTTAYGMYITNPVSDNSAKGNIAKVTVGGNVEAEGSELGIGIYVDKNLKNAEISVDGDIKASDYGIYVSNNMSDVSIKTDGTISSDGVAIVVVGTTTKEVTDTATNKAVNVDANVVPDITVWKIESGSKNLVAAQVTDDDTKSEALKNDVLSSINYIIKTSATEDGKEAESSKIVLEGTKGTVTIGDKTYDTAHQGDKIVINVVKGYKLTSLSNGQALLTAEADGTYTVEVPAGGGVDLKAVLEKIVEQKKSSSSSDSDDSGSSGSGTASSAASAGTTTIVGEPAVTTVTTADGATATTTTVTTAEGSTITTTTSGAATVTTTTDAAGVTTVKATVELKSGKEVSVSGASVSAEGTLASGLVCSGPSPVVALTGASKTADLPATVAATINAIDAGNLAAVPVATEGKIVLAPTVALSGVEAGTKLQLVMTASKVPASGSVQVLYFDKATGSFIIIAATVDPITGIVTFTAPGDGTAAIIG